MSDEKDSWLRDLPILHIYSQLVWHCEATLVGNREGLKTLRNAIDKALENPEKVQKRKRSRELSVMCNDGEGYPLYVKCTEDYDLLENMPVPYTDAVAKESDPKKWPISREDIVQGPDEDDT